MQAHQLNGVAFKRRTRVGRGLGSRRGTYSGRGVKGQKARAGARIRPGFEGGQTPLYARLPKRRGFRALGERPTTVSVGALARSFPAGVTVDLPELVRAQLVPPSARRIKVLADGALRHALTLRGLAVSAAAKEKIEKAGGTVRAQGNREQGTGKRGRTA